MWPDEQKQYVKKRAHQGASSETITIELAEIFGSESAVQDVELLREDMSLPGYNQDRALAAAVQDYKFPENSCQTQKKQFSSATNARPRPSEKATGHSQTKNDAAIASEPAVIEPQRIRIAFNPVYVDACVKGKTYIHAGIGPMLCTGIETQTYAGHDLKTAVLKESHTLSQPVTKPVILARFPKETIREPASPEILQQVLRKLQSGFSNVRGVPDVTARQAPVYDSYLNSPNIDHVTDLLCLFYGRSAKSEITSTAFKYGEKAMAIIAAEYALVMNVDPKKALRLISDTVGKTKPDPVYPSSTQQEPLDLSP